MTLTNTTSYPQVSGGSVDYSDAADGACATWEVVKTCDAIYQTRMRIYQSSKDSGLYAVAFRPTQQTPEVRCLSAGVY